MSDENRLDKTNVVDGDTLKVRLDEARNAPPALILLMGPTGVMGKQWPLGKSEIIIGREPTCDIHLDEKSMSKKHAKITIDGEQVNIIDLQSTNGTEVDSNKLVPHIPTLLKNNDTIKLGNVIFKFLSQGQIEAMTHATSYDRGTTDGLTRIFNKAATLAHLEESFKKAKLTDTNLSLIVFDLDHFKKVNDTYGHQGGDYVLREVASVVKNQLIRSGDIFGRYGGEEFVVVLYGSPLRRACDVAERIRSTIEKQQFLFGDKQIPVTVSLGVCCMDATIPTPEVLFAKADQALYKSKGSGRNRVSTL
ncbi:MAG: diguanylate cyclase [Oligoflexia bacterium]|nr:diguanylate cyclase [Oligoflexia bacterium]